MGPFVDLERRNYEAYSFFDSLKRKGWKSILLRVLIAVLYILVGMEIVAGLMAA